MNHRIVVWSAVGVFAALLSAAWFYAARRDSLPPHPPRTASGGAVRETSVVDTSTEGMRKTKRAPAQVDDSARKNDDPLPAKSSPPAAAPLVPPPISTESRPSLTGPDASAAPPISLATKAERPQTVAPRKPQKQTLYQAVDIRRSPSFSIQGLVTKQSLHYQVLSQLDLERSADPPEMHVVQIVHDTRLVDADDLSRDSFSKSLENLKRQQYTYRLNHLGEVIEFTGHRETRTTIPLDLASSTGFQLTSVIDEDGWKEIAELTFIVCPEERRQGEPWTRQMTHDWGALGSWTGVTTFTSQSSQGPLENIVFTRELNYTAPRAGTGGLPFQIRGAAFEVQTASGTIDFNVDQQRVEKAAEDFVVRGTVTAELAGVEVQIELAEQQRIEIFVSAQPLSLGQRARP